jgi:hypothetical protein
MAENRHSDRWQRTTYPYLRRWPMHDRHAILGHCVNRRQYDLTPVRSSDCPELAESLAATRTVAPRELPKDFPTADKTSVRK